MTDAAANAAMRPNDKGASSLMALSIVLGQLGVAAKPSDLRQRLGRDGGLDLKDAAFLAREHYQFRPIRHMNRPKARRAEKQLQSLPVPCLGHDGQCLHVFLGLEPASTDRPGAAKFFDPTTKSVVLLPHDQALHALG